MTTEFFLGAMSPYSWLSAERIEDFLPEAEWRSLYLGGLFKANGRISWGLTDAREAGLRDVEARAAARGLGPVRWPDPWPTYDLHVARAMLHAGRHGLLRSFALAAMRLSFLEGIDIGELAAVQEAGERVGLDPEELAHAIAESELKAQLREANDAATALGVFGVPTFRVGDDLFWGDDRLEAAARHARSSAGG